jgi:hypothetical protein
MIQSPGWADYVKLVEELKIKARREHFDGNLSAEAALAVNDYFDRALGIVEIVLTDSDAQLNRQRFEDEVVASRVDLEYDNPVNLL